VLCELWAWAVTSIWLCRHARRRNRLAQGVRAAAQPLLASTCRFVAFAKGLSYTLCRFVLPAGFLNRSLQVQVATGYRDRTRRDLRPHRPHHRRHQPCKGKAALFGGDRNAGGEVAAPADLGFLDFDSPVRSPSSHLETELQTHFLRRGERT